MSVHQLSRYCDNCRRRTLHERREDFMGQSWMLMLHVFATVMTCGLYLLALVLLYLFDLGAARPVYRCQRCGELN